MLDISLKVLLLLISVQFVAAQTEPKAVKIDEFGKTNCCDFGGRFDAFLIELSASKVGLNGYVVIHSNQQNARLALYFERLARSHIILRDFDARQISVIKKISEGALRIELWSVEKGGHLPFLPQDEGSFIWFAKSKNTLFFNSRNSGELCGEEGENKQFAEFLQADPNLKGHIVIFESSRRKFLKRKTELLSAINKERKVRPEQLKTVFIKVEHELYPYHELWLVPQRRKS